MRNIVLFLTSEQFDRMNTEYNSVAEPCWSDCQISLASDEKIAFEDHMAQLALQSACNEFSIPFDVNNNSHTMESRTEKNQPIYIATLQMTDAQFQQFVHWRDLFPPYHCSLTMHVGSDI